MNIENEEPWTEVPNEDVKTLIDSPSWRGLVDATASFYIEGWESALGDPCEDDEEAQNKYDFACGVAEEIIGLYLIRDEDDL